MKAAMRIALQVGITLLLIAFAGFCGFGFLASWEPDVVPGMNAIFRVLCAVIAMACLAVSGAVLFGRTRKALYGTVGLAGIWTAAVASFWLSL
jgi:hypothetical protein